MDSAITAGAFALGGVALGGALEWLRGRGSQRRAEAADCDNLFASLTPAVPGS